MHKQVIEKKSANVAVSPQGYLIVTKKRFSLNSADAVEISHNPEHWKIRPQTQIIAYYFKFLS